MIAGRGNRRRCDGERASRLETRMRDAADMPKLEEDGAAFRMDRGGHLAPALDLLRGIDAGRRGIALPRRHDLRSEEHTSELQSLMRISYAVFCLKKKTTRKRTIKHDIDIKHKD